MKLSHIGIMTLIIMTPLLVQTMNHAEAIGSICNLAGANSTEIKQCVKGYLEYQKMNHSTDSQMQQVLDSSRDAIRTNQKLQDQNQTQAWVESKGKIAQQMESSALIQREWYDQYTKDNQNKMNAEIKWWKTYDHNQVPAPQSCPKWTDCSVIVKPVVSNNTVTLKPEFSNHTSGIINNPTIIKNFYDLQKWLEGKNQTKN